MGEGLGGTHESAFNMGPHGPQTSPWDTMPRMLQSCVALALTLPTPTLTSWHDLRLAELDSLKWSPS